MKGIKREFSVARTPQQNRVAERKNRTLIEAARTMLADSKLPTTFWVEVVNTACYVQNRVLVIKPHNKTPYEIFLGRKPALSFMRPFGCPFTILNTIDHLGKFDGKADEGFFVGYSTNSKAFRVFNSRTRIVEENLHVKFSEETKCWNQSNGNASTKACDDAGFEDPDFPDRVYKVEKALYGLHQAPRAWYETLSTYLLENGFQRRQIDKALFIKRDQGDILIVQVYVDDIIFGSTKKKLCTEFEKMMHKKFQISSMGELTFFLGLQVKQKDDGIFISQDKYVTEILKKFGFSDVKTANTPMETHKPLLKDADGEDVDEHIYLKGQPKLGLWYPKDSPFDLVAYIDSDYAGASLDRKSTIGGCQFLGCRLISWQCKKQTVVANSTTEAEYVAASIKNPVFHSKIKHIEIRHHFIRDSNEKKLIQMIKIHTDKNVADLLTKAFDVSRFQYLIANIGMLNLQNGEKGIRVNAGDSKLMLLGINLLLLEKVNAARHNLLLLVVS
ncbi:putative ribonuclease H-like domain-containing protein [Tanacetum coccineum]